MKRRGEENVTEEALRVKNRRKLRIRVPRDAIGMPEAPMHIDNSHAIEITFGDTHISISNGADPVLVTKTLSVLRSYS